MKLMQKLEPEIGIRILAVDALLLTKARYVANPHVKIPICPPHLSYGFGNPFAAFE